MIEKSKYLLMKESTISDSYGNKYPDLATFNINNFTPNTRGIDYQLTYNDCLYFFNVISSQYSTFAYYDDIILWLNDIEYISDTDDNFEKYIKLYNKGDLDTWLLYNI